MNDHMLNRNPIFKYLPKDSHIAYEELARSRFHQAHIHMHDHNEILFITTDAECEIFSNGSVCRVSCPACVMHRGGSYPQHNCGLNIGAGVFKLGRLF